MRNTLEANNQRLLLDALDAVETTIRGRSIVPIIGNSNSGKSTLTANLLGQKLVPKRRGTSVILDYDTPTEAMPKFGHSMKSETLYSEGYLAENETCFVDCPGFGDDRSDSIKAITNVATELAINAAYNIRAVIVTIDFQELIASNGKYLLELADTLGVMIDHSTQAYDSFVFAVNKAPDGCDKEDVINELIDLKGAIERSVEDLDIPLTTLGQSDEQVFLSAECGDDDDLQAMRKLAKKMQVLQAILDRKDNLLVYNPLDTGQSRRKVMAKINGMDPIAKSAFNFKGASVHRVQFDKLLAEEANREVALLNEVLAIPLMLEQLQGESAQLLRDKAAAEEALEAFTAEPAGANEAQKQIAALRSAIDVNAVTRAENQRLIDGHQRTIDLFNREYATYDTAEPSYLTTLNFTDNTSWWPWNWQQVNEIIEFDTRRFNQGEILPFTHYDPVSHTGTLDEVTSEPEAGRLRLRLNVSKLTRAEAKVQFFVESRLHPANRVAMGGISARRNAVIGQQAVIIEQNQQLLDTQTTFETLIEGIAAGHDGLLADVDRERASLETLINVTLPAALRSSQENQEAASLRLAEVSELLASQLSSIELISALIENLGLTGGSFACFQSTLRNWQQRVAPQQSADARQAPTFAM